MKIGKYIFGGLLLVLLLSFGTARSCFADGFVDDFSLSSSSLSAWELSYSYGKAEIVADGKRQLKHCLMPQSQPWQDTPVSSGGSVFIYPGLQLWRAFTGSQWVFETAVEYQMAQSFRSRNFITWLCFGKSRDNSISFRRRVKQSGIGAHYNEMKWVVTVNGAVQQQGVISGNQTDRWYLRVVRGIEVAGVMDDKKLQVLWSPDPVTTDWIKLCDTEISQQIADSLQNGTLSQYVMINGGEVIEVNDYNGILDENSYAKYDYIKVKTPVSLFDGSDFSNPNFPNKGQPVLDDPEKLILGGREVKTAVADGVTRLLLILDVSEPGTADFSVDVPANVDVLANGSVSSIEQVFDTKISVPSVSTTQGQKIFAVYKVPDNFVNTIPDKYISEREITINIKHTPQFGNAGNVQNISQKIKLIRPPVVLIHGTWGKPEDWSNSSSGFEGVLKNDIRGIQISMVDYKTSNAGHFSYNWRIVAKHIRLEVQRLRNSGIAVSQVDIIAHSMGGLLSRIFSQMTNQYETEDNFKEGYINKLITIDTAHYGTIMADLITGLRDGNRLTDIVDVVLSIPTRDIFKFCVEALLGPIDEGAVDDQTVKHLTIDSPLKPSSIPSFTVVGDITLNKKILDFVDDLDPPFNELFVILKWFGVDTTFSNLPKFWNFIQETDTIIEGSSQRGGLYGQATQTWAHLHGKAPENPDVQKKAIFLLNSDVNSGNFGNFN